MRWTINPASDEALPDQIAGCVRRGVASGELVLGEQLPPAAELGVALSVDRNTVLAAYRRLRDEGLLEFRRGRGVRVASVETDIGALREPVRALLVTARQHGFGPVDVIHLIKELS
ncbi:MAG: GntR family transcriptional regulator [Nocardioides sp.]